MNADVIISSLRAEGYRITKAREEVVRILASGGHFSADDIAKQLSEKMGESNVATVYNNLNFLVREGIISENKFETKSKYELNSGVHAHLICIKCNKVEEDFNIPGLNHIQKVIEDSTKFIIKEKNLVFKGICSDCQKKD